MQRRIADYKRKILKGEHAVHDSHLATINVLAYAIEARDPYTRGHSERVANYAGFLGKKVGLSSRRNFMLRQCCRLHDVGKIAVADYILQKPGSLTIEEKAKIDLHPVYGAHILEGLDFIASGMPVILHHHERHDGKGYPYGLKKNQIPFEVKIITIMDAFDAMTSDRPYRKAMSMSEVIRELRENSGTQFDPKLTKIFLKILEENNAAKGADVLNHAAKHQ